MNIEPVHVKKSRRDFVLTFNCTFVKVINITCVTLKRTLLICLNTMSMFKDWIPALLLEIIHCTVSHIEKGWASITYCVSNRHNTVVVICFVATYITLPLSYQSDFPTLKCSYSLSCIVS